MVTPSKKRKRNEQQSSPQAGRSLDFFFSKAKQNAATKESTESKDQNTLATGAEAVQMTDEEYARRLQAEWDTEGGSSILSKIKADSEYVESMPVSSGLDNAPSKLAAEIVDVKEVTTTENQTPKASVNTLSLQSSSALEDIVTSSIPFDDDPLAFSPSKYLPELRKVWTPEGGSATYALLTRCFVLVNSTRSRIKIVDTLVNFLRTLIEGDPNSILPAVSPPSICKISASSKQYYRSGLRRMQFPLLIYPSSLGWVALLSPKPL
jgi:DNA ligase 1